MLSEVGSFRPDPTLTPSRGCWPGYQLMRRAEVTP